MNLKTNKMIDLIEKYGNNLGLRKEIEKRNFLKEHPKFKVGQVIEFNGGYNDDIRFKSEIMGFHKDGDIYVLWDCFWFPIKDDAKRNIKVLS